MGRKWLPYVCFICNSFAFVYFASMDFAPFVLGFFLAFFPSHDPYQPYLCNFNSSNKTYNQL
jgi:hypothetical protein